MHDERLVAAVLLPADGRSDQVAGDLDRADPSLGGVLAAPSDGLPAEAALKRVVGEVEDPVWIRRHTDADGTGFSRSSYFSTVGTLALMDL